MAPVNTSEERALRRIVQVSLFIGGAAPAWVVRVGLYNKSSGRAVPQKNRELQRPLREVMASSGIISVAKWN